MLKICLGWTESNGIKFRMKTRAANFRGPREIRRGPRGFEE
jgi:hypothetical protein